MTAAGQIQAGSRITAAMLQGIAPLAVIKGADESITSSTTLQFDDALFLPIQANAQYIFDCYLLYEGGTAGSSDMRWTWSVPTGSTLRYQPIYANATSTLNASLGTSVAGSTLMSGTSGAGTNGAGNLRGLSMNGTLIVGSTPGNLSLEWAQNTSSATPTIVHAQSYVTLWQVV